MRAVIALWLALACASPADPAAVEASEEDTNDTDDTDDTEVEDPAGDLTWDSGFFEDPPEQSQPLFTAEELATQLNEALAVLGDVAPKPALAEYVRLMAQGDESCPGDPMSYILGLQGCTSSTDYTYTGLSIFVDSSTTSGEGIIRELVGFQLADIVFIEPDGTRFAGAGLLDRTSRYQGEGNFIDSTIRVTGSWVYEKSDTIWLAQGLSATLNVMEIPSGGDSPALVIRGGVATGDISLAYNALTFGDPVCPDTPRSGSEIQLRQPDGSWNTLAFKGDCTGCFTASWDGREELGEACVDLSGLYAFYIDAFEQDLL